MLIVPAQVGGPLVAQFVEFGAVGILLLLLALIINGTFRLRREVNGVKGEHERELTEIRQDRDYWKHKAELLEEREARQNPSPHREG